MSEAKKQKLTMDTAVQYVKGVGPRRAAVLNKVQIFTVADLLYYFPRRYLDRSHVQTIGRLHAGEEVTVVGKVYSTETASGRKKRLIVLVSDGSGFLQCVWFQGIQYVSKTLKTGDTVAFSGKVTYYRGPQLVHPEYDKISDSEEKEAVHTRGIIPMYSSTDLLSKSGLDSRGFRRILHDVTHLGFPDIQETLSTQLIHELNLLSLPESLKHIHFPADWQIFKKAQYRLKFEELFYIQLFLSMQRSQRKLNHEGIAFRHVGEKTRELVDALPFDLTEAQKRVLREIHQDMKDSKPMNRLLQGDVGSGKTIVALIAMLITVENGYQAALMAPTEILAEQHYLTLHHWLESLGANVALLKGSQKSREKQEISEQIRNGDIDIIVGTHAIIQDNIRFARLGFVVVDEQHRFGVLQRSDLIKKGKYPDVLVMTATPIPRTLALTLYGDLDVSILNELPKGRQPVQTVWRGENKREAIYQFIHAEVKKGRQAYIVYPLVEESEKSDLAAATEGYESLSSTCFKDCRLALLHGRMKSEDKEETMQAFKRGDIQILVTTTVIEVGVDVPNATVILIEHAERFGLTQLHQLRGRVGRGKEKSACILLSQYPISDEAKTRLKTMTQTQDGFKIAEADLEIRGPGEIFGTRQHGVLNLKLADLTEDSPILELARKKAFSLIDDDPELLLTENRMIHEQYKKRYAGQIGLIEVG